MSVDSLGLIFLAKNQHNPLTSHPLCHNLGNKKNNLYPAEIVICFTWHLTLHPLMQLFTSMVWVAWHQSGLDLLAMRAKEWTKRFSNMTACHHLLNAQDVNIMLQSFLVNFLLVFHFILLYGFLLKNTTELYISWLQRNKHR